MAVQRADGSTGISTGLNSLGSFDSSLSSRPTKTVAQHPRLRENTERARKTKARIPGPADPSIEVKSKDLDFLPGPDGNVVTNVFAHTRKARIPAPPANSTIELKSGTKSKDLDSMSGSGGGVVTTVFLKSVSDLTVSRNSSVGTRAVGSERRQCAACKQETACFNENLSVYCFVPDKRTSQPKNTYKVYTCVNPACRADTSTCPNSHDHGGLQWVWIKDTKSSARSRSGRWQLKCNECIKLRKTKSASRKSGMGAKNSKTGTQVTRDEAVVKDMLRRNAFRHLSSDLQTKIMTQIGACSVKVVGRATKLTCEWTRCNYCRALYKHNSGIKNRHTEEKCIVFQDRRRVVRSSPDVSSYAFV